MGVLHDITHATAICNQSNEFVCPFVLQRIDAVCDTHHGVSGLEDILVGDAIIQMKRPTKAGINHHDGRVGSELVCAEVFKMQVGSGLIDGVQASQRVTLRMQNPRVGQVKLLQKGGRQRVGIPIALLSVINMLPEIAHDEGLGTGYRIGQDQFVEVLGIKRTVMVQHGKIHILAHELAHQSLLHGIDIVVRDITHLMGAPFELWKMLEIRYFLVYSGIFGS